MECVNEEIRNSVKEALNILIGQKGNTEFAKSIDVSRDDINNWVAGRSIIRANAIVKIHHVYNVSADWILGLSKYQSPDVRIQGTQELTGLSAESIETLQGYNESAHDSDSVISSFHHNLLNTVNDLLSSEEGTKVIENLAHLRASLSAISQYLESSESASFVDLDRYLLHELEIKVKYLIIDTQEAFSRFINDYMGAKRLLGALADTVDKMENVEVLSDEQES